MGRGLEAGWGLAEGWIQQRFVGEWVEGGGRGVPPVLGAQLERRGLRPSLCCIVTPPGLLPSAFCWAFFTQIHLPLHPGGGLEAIFPHYLTPSPPSRCWRGAHRLQGEHGTSWGALPITSTAQKKPPKPRCAPRQPSTSTQPIPQPWGWAWTGWGGYTGTAPVSGLEAHWD